MVEPAQEIRAVMFPDASYLSNDGLYRQIWERLKERLQLRGYRVAEFVGDSPPESEPHACFYKNMSAGERGQYDVAVGLFHPAYEAWGDTGWVYSRPAFVRNYTVIYKQNDNTWRLFGKLFLLKFMPVAMLFVCLSFVLGIILYTFTPRTSRKNAVWQTYSAMMGEFGYLSEKVSDRSNRMTLAGYVITGAMLMVCLYCYLYMQSTINTTMIYSRNDYQTRLRFTEARSNKRLRVEAGHDVIDSARLHKVDRYFDMVEATGDREPKPNINGRLVDTVLSDTYKNTDWIFDVQNTVGHHGVSLLINPKRADLVRDIDQCIQDMQANREITRLCDMQLNAKAYQINKNACHL